MSPTSGTPPFRALAGAGCLVALLAAQAPAVEGLVSVKVAAPPTLDGTIEAAWQAAPPLKLTLDKAPYKPDVYPGMASTEITLRSAYDAENIYFVVQYKDPTQSLARLPWVKQADGSWKQAGKPDSTGHENTTWEDKFAILWDMNAKGFGKLGCAVVCHATEKGSADKSPGRKWVRAGETVDMWSWEAVLGGASGQMEDGYINDNTPPDADEFGRRQDEGAGGYSANLNEAKNGPAFADDKKTPLADTLKAGDSVPSVLVTPFTGSRADIACAAKYADGMWTIEFKRKLVTSGDKAAAQDVQFSDLAKAYAFGVGVFDNAEINHLYHTGSPKLTFKP